MPRLSKQEGFGSAGVFTETRARFKGRDGVCGAVRRYTVNIGQLGNLCSVYNVYILLTSAQVVVNSENIWMMSSCLSIHV